MTRTLSQLAKRIRSLLFFPSASNSRSSATITCELGALNLSRAQFVESADVAYEASGLSSSCRRHALLSLCSVASAFVRSWEPKDTTAPIPTPSPSANHAEHRPLSAPRIRVGRPCFTGRLMCLPVRPAFRLLGMPGERATNCRRTYSIAVAAR